MDDDKGVKQFKLPALAVNQPPAAKKPSPFRPPKPSSSNQKRSNIFGDDEDEERSAHLAATPKRAAQESSSGGSGPRPQLGPPKRHFVPGAQGRKSGPGTLDPHLDSNFTTRPPVAAREDDHGRLGYDDGVSKAAEERKAAEKAAPNPTLHLSSLYPRMSHTAIKALIPPSLKVEKIDILDPNKDGSSSARQSKSAIVTLGRNTPARDIDAAVSKLQDRYLQVGYHLKISRHLSSAVLGSGHGGFTSSLSATSQDLPFGAKSAAPKLPSSMNAVPPPKFDGRPANSYGAVPPPSLDERFPPGHGRPMPEQTYSPFGGARFGREALTEVPVEAPKDIKQIRLINKVIERILRQGPEFEALLMTRPEVQRDEKWAWIWDARSIGGIWYRWKLWQALTKFERGPKRQKLEMGDTHHLFNGGSAWLVSEPNLPFELCTNLEEIVHDPDYDSEEEDEMQENAFKPGESSLPPEEEEKRRNKADFLDPKERAKLTFLLSRLPFTAAKVRRGDLARITGFAINHTSRGAREISHHLVDNVRHPYNTSATANPDGAPLKESDDTHHTENATLVALHAVSDLLSSCPNTRVFKAWTYRKFLEDSMKSRQIFVYLGRMGRDESWGRLRREKWKRAIKELLYRWEGSNCFTTDAQNLFTEQFNNPPLTAVEAATEREKEKEKEERAEAVRAARQAVDAFTTDDEPEDALLNADHNGVPMSEIDDEATVESDVDGEPMVDSDVDGEAMDDSDVDMDEDGGTENKDKPTADDMFAD